MAQFDVYRSEVWQNVGSEPTMNVLHMIETTAETGGTNGATIIADFISNVYDALSAQLSEDWRVIQVSTRRISPGGGVPDTIVLGAAEAVVGAIASEIVPSQCAGLISFYSSTADRTGRGRLYLPGIPELHQNEGQFTEDAYSDLQTIVSAQFEGEKTPPLASDGRYRFIVFGGGASPTLDYTVQSAQLRPNLATQRRRRAFPGFGA